MNNSKIDNAMVEGLHIVKNGKIYRAYLGNYKSVGSYNNFQAAKLALMQREPRKVIYLHNSSGKVIREIKVKYTKVIDLRDNSAKPRRKIKKARILDAK